MIWHDIALGLAGVIGAGTAVVHGVLTQKLMVRPFEAAAPSIPGVSAPIRRLTPVLLHLSTVSWFLGGLALIAAIGFEPGARLATGVLVGGLFLYGAIGNFWGTRGRHPGWMLMSAALVLIALGVRPAG